MGTGGVMIRLLRGPGSTAWRALSFSLLLGGSLAARAESALVLDVTSDDDVDPRLLESLTKGVFDATTTALAPRGISVISGGTIAAVFLRCGDDRCRRNVARAGHLRFIIQERLRVLSTQARLQLVVSDGERVIAERSVASPAAIDLLDVVAEAARAVAIEAYHAAPALPPPAPPPVQPPASVDSSGDYDDGEADDGRGSVEANDLAGSSDEGSASGGSKPPAIQPQPDTRAAVKVDSPALGIAIYWGLVLVAGGLGAVGLALDVVPATAKNHQFDLLDLTGPMLYAAAGTVAAVATFAPLPGSPANGPTVGCVQCGSACALCSALWMKK